MPDGRTHDIAANAVVAVGAALCYYYAKPFTATVLTAGLVLGRVAGPDNRDQERVTNYGEQLVYRYAGQALGSLWQAYWWPLAAWIEHRDWKSHLPGPATLIAWVYLFGPFLIALRLLWPEHWEGVAVVAAWLWPGWFVQDVVHVGMDVIHSALRRWGFSGIKF